MKKYAVFILAAIVCISLGACGNRHEVSAAPVRMIQEDQIPPEAQTGDKNYLDHLSHSGNDDFTRNFTCSSDDGNQLLVYVQNNGDKPVLVNITWEKEKSKKEYPATSVEANGGDSFQIFSYEEDCGIDGNWTVNITSESGDDIDINVTARQYATKHEYTLDELNCTIKDENGNVVYEGAFGQE